ncbi:MAG: tetratricopeptide repeat protein [Victivallales bacterium]
MRNINTIYISMLMLMLLQGCKMFAIPDDIDPINEIPMYGGERVPFENKKFDESTKAADDGWDRLFIQKDLRNAMKFFNQAWMYNCDNPKAYWGMGLVTGIEAVDEKDTTVRMNKIDMSIKLLQKALELDAGNVSIMSSIGKAYIDKACRLEDKAEKGVNLKKAEEILTASSKLAQRGSTYFNLSICLYHQERYEDAWKMLQRANDLNYKIPPDYLNNLKNRLNK